MSRLDSLQITVWCGGTWLQIYLVSRLASLSELMRLLLAGRVPMSEITLKHMFNAELYSGEADCHLASAEGHLYLLIPHATHI